MGDDGDSDGDDLFTITKHGRAHLIECHDPSQCSFYGNKYLALSDSDEPGVAFWNDLLYGWIVRPEDREEAEYFVHQANHPKNRQQPLSQPVPQTSPIHRSARLTPPPAPTRTTRRFPIGEEQGFVRRQLFTESDPVTESDESGVDDDDSSSDYVFPASPKTRTTTRQSRRTSPKTCICRIRE